MGLSVFWVRRKKLSSPSRFVPRRTPLAQKTCVHPTSSFLPGSHFLSHFRVPRWTSIHVVASSCCMELFPLFLQLLHQWWNPHNLYRNLQARQSTFPQGAVTHVPAMGQLIPEQSTWSSILWQYLVEYFGWMLHPNPAEVYNNFPSPMSPHVSRHLWTKVYRTKLRAAGRISILCHPQRENHKTENHLCQNGTSCQLDSNLTFLVFFSELLWDGRSCPLPSCANLHTNTLWEFFGTLDRCCPNGRDCEERDKSLCSWVSTLLVFRLSELPSLVSMECRCPSAKAPHATCSQGPDVKFPAILYGTTHDVVRQSFPMVSLICSGKRQCLEPWNQIRRVRLKKCSWCTKRSVKGIPFNRPTLKEKGNT